MAEAGIGVFLMVAAASFGTAAFTLILAAQMAGRRQLRRNAGQLLHGAETGIAFLFDGEVVQDATPAAKKFLHAAPLEGTGWARLAGLLRHRYPDLDTAMANLATAGRVELAAADGTDDRLIAEWVSGLARVVLLGAGQVAASHDTHADEQSLRAMEAELETLRSVVQTGPVAVWKQAPDGTILWANEVYFALAAELLGAQGAHSWPPPALFPVSSGNLADQGFAPAPFRAALRGPDGQLHSWFECHGFAAGDHLLCHAVPADNLVNAEEALREFVQTLSKTFAQLPIGLAVFDRARRLALFNPALTDLTTLGVEFMAGRPTLFAFLDKLRDHRRIPEPRDYRSWRQKIVDLEAAAAGGFVQENWTLPSGQTFRVTGRPHPDGAVAFLFEDISAEVSLTRRFRSEIELGQTVMDSLNEAIAVFSASGIITFSNAAYTALWGIDPGITLAETGIIEATRLWQARSVPTPIWGDAREFLATSGERAEWTGAATLTDGRVMTCRFQPLSGGASLVGFAVAEAVARPAEPRARKKRPMPAVSGG